MAAFREILTINSFTVFGTGEQTQDVLSAKLNNESIGWVQTAVTLKTQ